MTLRNEVMDFVSTYKGTRQDAQDRYYDEKVEEMRQKRRDLEEAEKRGQAAIDQRNRELAQGGPNVGPTTAPTNIPSPFTATPPTALTPTAPPRPTAPVGSQPQLEYFRRGGRVRRYQGGGNVYSGPEPPPGTIDPLAQQVPLPPPEQSDADRIVAQFLGPRPADVPGTRENIARSLPPPTEPTEDMTAAVQRRNAEVRAALPQQIPPPQQPPAVDLKPPSQPTNWWERNIINPVVAEARPVIASVAGRPYGTGRPEDADPAYMQHPEAAAAQARANRIGELQTEIQNKRMTLEEREAREKEIADLEAVNREKEPQVVKDVRKGVGTYVDTRNRAADQATAAVDRAVGTPGAAQAAQLQPQPERQGLAVPAQADIAKALNLPSRDYETGGPPDVALDPNRSPYPTQVSPAQPTDWRPQPEWYERPPAPPRSARLEPSIYGGGPTAPSPPPTRGPGTGGPTGTTTPPAPPPGGTANAPTAVRKEDPRTRTAAFDPTVDRIDVATGATVPRQFDQQGQVVVPTGPEVREMVSHAMTAAPTQGADIVGNGAVSRPLVREFVAQHNQGGRLTDGQALMVGMMAKYKFLLSRGHVKEAASMAWGLIQSANLEAASYGKVAQDQLQAGDLNGARQSIAAAADWLPDGMHHRATANGIATYDSNGRLVGHTNINGATALAAALGLADGTLLWQALNEAASSIVPKDKDAEGRELRNELTRLRIERERQRGSGKGGGGGTASVDPRYKELDEIFHSSRRPRPKPESEDNE
jgi:hypothetical protein